jgi:hypothetical protein
VICQFCEREYPEGIERCAECGCDLIETLPEEGDEVVLEPLPVLREPAVLGDLVARLEAERIPYIVHAGTALAMLEMQHLRGAAAPEEWEARVLVVSSRFAEARSALRAAMAGAAASEYDDVADAEAIQPD